MKRIVLSIVLLLTLLLSTPAFAKEKEPTGTRIWINDSGSQTFPANTAFYIRHGWGGVTPPDNMPGQIFYKLEVDSVYINPTYVEYTTYIVDSRPSMLRSWFFNFPDGMTGQHTFESHWVSPCFYALQWGYTTECANPMADYDWYYYKVVIDFGSIANSAK